MDNLNNNVEENFNIGDIISKYLSFWKWFVVCGLISLVAAFTYLRYTSSIYQTTVKIKILDNSKGGSPLPELSALFSNSRVNLSNEMEVLKSHRLIKRVTKDLNLSTSYFKVGNIKSPELWNDAPFKVFWVNSEGSILKEPISFHVILKEEGYQMSVDDNVSGPLYKYGKVNAVKKFNFILKLNTTDTSKFDAKFKVVRNKVFAVVENLVNILGVKVSNESEVLILTLRGTNKGKSEDILNAIIEKFNEDGIQDRQLVSQRTIDFVNERFVYLSYELDSIENRKESYKKVNDLSYLEADASLTSSKIAFVDKEYFSTQTQIALSSLIQETLATDKKFSLLPSFGVENVQTNELIKDYNKAVLERGKVMVSAGEENPMVVELTNRLIESKENILKSIGVLQNQLSVTLKKLEKLKTENSSVFRKIPEKEKILRSIERQQSIKESLYLFLLQKREEASVANAITTPSIKVVDYAITKRKPISPKRNIIYIVFLVIGLIIPFAIIYIILLLDTKIHGKLDFERLSPNIPIISEIPFIEENNRVITKNDRSMLAESFRILRTNINYLIPLEKKGECSVIYTGSSIKGEGKTFVSLNLALTYASLGKKTLLLGADLRNPRIHQYFNLEKDRPGVSNYLYDGNTEWQNLINLNMFDNESFNVLFAGAVPPNPAELLSNGRFEELLAILKNEYDYIIVDTAPTILVTDTLLISQLADVTVYVTRANHTDKKLLTYANGLNEQGKLNNMAYVINNVGGVSGYGYGYGYGYNYGYGYGYGSDDKKQPKSTFLKKLFKQLKIG
jgi:capsular exopolysaccharide synthesis family protein